MFVRVLLCLLVNYFFFVVSRSFWSAFFSIYFSRLSFSFKKKIFRRFGVIRVINFRKLSYFRSPREGVPTENLFENITTR